MTSTSLYIYMFLYRLIIRCRQVIEARALLLPLFFLNMMSGMFRLVAT